MKIVPETCPTCGRNGEMVIPDLVTGDPIIMTPEVIIDREPDTIVTCACCKGEFVLSDLVRSE